MNGQEIASFITFRDENKVSAVKKQLGSAFTTASFLKQEEIIDEKLEQLMLILRNSSPVVEISSMLSYWAFDVISKIAFSEDQDFMTHNSDIEDTMEGARSRFAHWHYWTPMPWVEKILFKNKLLQRAGKPSMLAKLAVEKIQTRKADVDPESQVDLLGKYLAASQRAPEWISSRDVIGLTVSTIHAGADTTATTSTIILYNLCRNQEAMKRLQNELSGAKLTKPLKFLELNKLGYLDAVIRESMSVIFQNTLHLLLTSPLLGGFILQTRTPLSAKFLLVVLKSVVPGSLQELLWRSAITFPIVTPQSGEPLQMSLDLRGGSMQVKNKDESWRGQLQHLVPGGESV